MANTGLAHVEYHFADLLSVMESGRADGDGRLGGFSLPSRRPCLVARNLASLPPE